MKKELQSIVKKFIRADKLIGGCYTHEILVEYSQPAVSELENDLKYFVDKYSEMEMQDIIDCFDDIEYKIISKLVGTQKRMTKVTTSFIYSKLLETYELA